MNKSDLIRLKKWFSHYVEGYLTGDEQYDLPVRLKQEHTEKVCDNILILCRGLNVMPQELILAETIAYCHDLGRFEQYARYGTFNDATSENHARLGLREMGKHGLLSGCTRAEKRVISKAVAYHNAPSIGNEGNGRDGLFIRLIRDADKLDVWRVLIDYYRNRGQQPHQAIELGLPDEPVFSREIIDAFYIPRAALLKDAKTISDVILLQISWVFDLNFAASFQMVQQRQVIEQLYGFLPPSASIRLAVEQARRHVEKNLPQSSVKNNL